MTKPRTAEDFSNLVTGDYTWRLKELSNLKAAVNGSGASDKPTFLRSLVVMCYAHWEGHAKFCGDRFLEYLTMRSLKFSEINRTYYDVRFLREIGSANSMNYKRKMDLVRKIQDSQEDRFSHFPRELIDTKSNLNSVVLEDLCIVCGIDYIEFANDADFIDRMLLKRRNEVAHGEAVFIEAVDFEDMINRTLQIMRTFRNSLENLVALGLYRRVAQAVQ